MNLLLVNWLDGANPQAGGAEVHLHQTFGRLASRGHSVTLLTSGWVGAPRREELDGMEVHRVGGRHTFLLRAWPYFRSELADREFDLVVEDLNKVPLFTPLWTRTPVALLVHHLFGRTAFEEASLPVATLTWLLERPIPTVFRRAPVVAVSESTARDLADRGLDRDRITVIPNGVDLERYSPSPEADEFGEPTLLYLGRLKRYKRVDLIIRAVHELRRRGIEARLLLAGKGDHRSELEDLVGELDLGDRVRFLGYVSEEEKLDLFRRSWVHLLTSPKEGWGIANLEAAACGTPTVASDSPGLRESVVDGATGFLAPHGDIPGLAERIEKLVTRDELRREMGRRARSFAEGYSWDATADAMETFLARVAGAEGRT